MDLVEVDPVGLQALQAGFALLDDVTPRIAGCIGIVVVHFSVYFGCQDNAVAFAIALEGIAGYGFAFAAAVYVGGIDKVDAGSDGVVDDFVGDFGLGASTKVHASQTEGTYFDAGAAECAVFHGFLLVSMAFH